MTFIAVLTHFTGTAFAQTPDATLNFPAQKIFTSSAAQSFTILGLHLTTAVTVSVKPPFFISEDSTSDFQSTIIFDTLRLALNHTVYVKFKPTEIRNYADSVVNRSDGADSKIITLTGKASSRYSGSNNNHLAANNVITPNGDGHNDTWVIKNLEQYPNNTVKVMDKAGNIIYSAKGYNNDWDGTYQNAPLPQGTYYYVVDFGEGADMIFTGFITIVRD